MKRFWLPPQKGTGPGPTIQAPTKLVIRGVQTGTPLYRVVAQKFGGHLKQFHGKQQQMYALSDNPIARGRVDWGGARATYTNIAGQETLELEVDAETLAELKQESEDRWDWVLINFKVSDQPVAEFSAFMRAPLLEPYVDGARGVSVDYGNDGHGKKPMSFPDGTNIEFQQLAAVTTAGSYTAASLLVDLTIVDPKAGAVIDIYGKLPDESAPQCGLQGNRLPVTYTITLPANPPGSDLSGTSIAGPLIDDYPWSIQGYIWTRLDGDCSISRRPFYLGSNSTIGVLGTFPAQLTMIQNGVQFTAVRSGTTLTVTVESVDGEDRAIYGTWDSSSSGAPDNYWLQLTVSGKTTGTWSTSNSYHASVGIAYSDESGSPADSAEPFGGYTTANGGAQTNYNYVFVPYIHATDPPGPEDVGTTTAPLLVAGVVGKGSAQWLFSEHASDVSNFKVWEGNGIYPNPIPTSILADNLAISNRWAGDAEMSPLYDMPKLGTILVERRYGSLVFKPA